MDSWTRSGGGAFESTSFKLVPPVFSWIQRESKRRTSSFWFCLRLLWGFKGTPKGTPAVSAVRFASLDRNTSHPFAGGYVVYLNRPLGRLVPHTVLFRY